MERHLSPGGDSGQNPARDEGAIKKNQDGYVPGFETQIKQANLRTEEANQRTEEAKIATFRLAAIIETSEDAIVSKTLDGIIIGWNQGAERLYGYMAEEIIGRSISLLSPADHYQEYLQIIKRVKHGEKVPPFDTMRRRKDGTLIDVSVCIIPIGNREGEVVEATYTSHDITRIKKLEAQFIEAQKMEVVGQLAGGVAHDFNNVLSVIIGYSDLLMKELRPDGPGQKYVSEIQHAAERAAGLTQQLLVFSSKQAVQPIVLDLNNVLQDLDKMLRRLIDENIELTIVPGKEIGRIKADSGYIGQVLMNLVVNARDAMPNGGKLTITTANATLGESNACTHTDTIPGAYVMLSVCDTGTGMTDEVKARMFEAFFTTKPKGKGTGLGLATCQTIVQQSGGHIRVVSEVGKGTTFKFYFPRVDEPMEESIKPGDRGSLLRGTETLLLVEDEPSLRFLACAMLEAQGYTVLRANNGQEALRVAREYKGVPISLVITDVIMPQMGGKVMAEWLKTTYPDLKILFTSGYTGDMIARHGVLESEVKFLPKPYTQATLLRKVRSILDNTSDTVMIRK